MEKVILQVLQDLDCDGWQDDDGVIHYDDSVRTKFGNLGNLRVEKSDDTWVIKETPGVALFSDGFIKSLVAGYVDDCTTLSMSPLGTNTVLIRASNGVARYQLHVAELEWSDRPDEPVNCQLATLTHQDWTPA